MIPDNHAKSFLSKSYVNAIATQAGFGCQFTEPDYGIDAKISEIQFYSDHKYSETGYHFNIQIKASHAFSKKNGSIIYDLEADAYNRLVRHKGGLIVLVLFCLPKIPDDRIYLTENCLELRNCCYWYYISGEETGNKSSITLNIPRNQVFDPVACTIMMNSVKTDDWRKGHL